MRLWTLLCVCVGFAFASQNPGWQENKEYVYQVRSRSLASLNENTKTYSGVFFKALLNIKPTTDGKLYGKISDPQYAPFHDELEEGWRTDIPDSKLSYKRLDGALNTPFKMEMNNGVIQNLYVSRDITNWEANVIKSIVSQFQLDTYGDKLIPSYINNLPTYGSNNMVYQTMEETVTGISETLYEIHPLPEQAFQSAPWLVPLSHLHQDEEMIEIVKTKNFTNSENRPSYHFGFHGIEDYDLSNKIGDFFSRTSESRAVITGSLDSYTIQSSVTVDQIIINPTLSVKERGSVNTVVNTTLVSVQPQSGSRDEVPDPVKVGVVYAYDKPYSGDNQPRSQQEYEDETNLKYKLQHLLFHRSSSDDSSSSEEQKVMRQEQPNLTRAPESPLLPFTVGYKGQSLKKQQNVVETVRRLAKLIAKESINHQRVISEETVGKFITLSSLVRIMDHQEVEEVARSLYVRENQGQNDVSTATWKTFRDAVAQAGTGPTLLMIDNWIKNWKISEEEAAEVVCRAASTARQPTLEYMRYFYEMLQKDYVKSQAYLNESALLCYSSLLHDVYVDKEISHNKYPVYSFGPFRTAEGKQFVENEVIPDLSQKLHEAVVKADVQNIHTYIRALGNVGHSQILEAFKPYLEGQKQVSQFQRLLMVIALDKLASSNPKTARSVLYRLYQNSHEDEQVRVAAVAQLMRTNPPPSMLQRMASFTKVDPHHYVNAAVKSAIESASQLEGYEHEQLRSAAEAAKPLLTPRQYGVQYSQQKLRSYVIEQIQMAYKQTVQTFGSEDYLVPKGISYKLRSRLGGLKQQVLNMQAIVSSTDDLINVLQQQTKKYQEEKEKKQSHKGHEHKLSSEYTARFMNMENEQQEQLEGMLYFQIDALQKVWSFDNHTLANISQVVRQLEEGLKDGKEFNYRKMSIQNELAISFPTALGLPFIYTYDEPAFVSLQASVKAHASRQLSSGRKIEKPDSVYSEFEFNGSITTRTQSQFGIFTPFDNQRYSTGYEKNVQVVLPIVGNAEMDLINSQLKLELVPITMNDVNLIHYSSIPFTARNNIYEPKLQKNVIKSRRPHVVDTVIGEESTGIALTIQATSDNPINFASMYDKLRYHDLISAQLNPWLDENIHHSEINIGINVVKSYTRKINIAVGYQYRYDSGRKEQSGSLIKKIDRIPNSPANRRERQTRFMELSRQNIKKVQSHAIDALIEFSGDRNIKYTATLAGSKSNVHSKNRIILHLHKQDNGQQTKNFYLVSEGQFPNTNGLNMDHAMEMDTTSNIDIEAGIGESYEKSQKMTANIMLSKSQERKQWLKGQPEYEECKRQMEEGNNQLPVCAKMTAQANLLDVFEMRVNYDQIDPRMINATYKLYSLLRHHLYPRVEEDIISSPQENKNEVYVKGQFRPDLKAVNFSIDSDYGRAQVKDVEINEWFKQVLVPHPVFHLKARMMSHFYKYYAYRPICVVDKTAASTFDNKTYPLILGNDWTVLLHYVPRRPSWDQLQQSVQEQLKQQTESYITWIRAYGKDPSKKEIKMIVQSPDTHGSVVDISLKPSDSFRPPRLYINNEEIDYKNRENSNIYGDYLQVYTLPNNEVKVELKNSYYLIYDGTRVKLTVGDSKFRDASRGLCGTFTGEPETDFTSPQNCIISDPEEFVRSYTLSEQNQKVQEGSKCYQKKTDYVQVISSDDIQRSNYERKSLQRTSCTKHQTRYVESGDQTCFTLRPLPFCKSGCQPVKNVSKYVPVHCVESIDTADIWKNQIDKGTSPDFSMKSESKKIEMEIPTGCSSQSEY